MFQLTAVVFRNLVGRKATRRHPFERRPAMPDTRGGLRLDRDRCRLCGQCARRCPSRCLQVDRPAAMWRWDPFACVYCGQCVAICPERALRQEIDPQMPVLASKSVVELRCNPANARIPRQRRHPGDDGGQPAGS